MIPSKAALSDLLALTIWAAVAAAELAVLELYHNAGVEVLPLAGLACVWLGCVAVLFMPKPRWLTVEPQLVHRVAFVVMALAACWALSRGRWPAFAGWVGAWAPMAAAALGALLGAWLARRAHAATWSRLRNALTVAAVLFALAPLPLVASATHIDWPPERLAQEAPGTTVVFLFDELNGRSAAPLVQAIKALGLKVASRTMVPVADGTAKVIPALFSGLRLDQPRPCSTTAVCSGTRVLDFGRIATRRDDVDLVGFFEPYCAIRGLRSCTRVPVADAGLGLDRWRCALRRFGLFRDAEQATRCMQFMNAPWLQMAEGVRQAVWQAPTWTRGGLLFVHWPLPHPPSAVAEPSLAKHYEANLLAVDAIVMQGLQRLSRGNPGRWRLIVFSDHPLRKKMWCGSHLEANASACLADPQYRDETVPVVVVDSFAAPELEKLPAHQDVFRLVLPAH